MILACVGLVCLTAIVLGALAYAHASSPEREERDRRAEYRRLLERLRDEWYEAMKSSRDPAYRDRALLMADRCERELWSLNETGHADLGAIRNGTVKR